MRPLAVVSLLAVAALGCKDQPTKKAPPPNVGSASGPKKTTKPHTKADYERLAKLDYAGYERDVRVLSDQMLEVRYIKNDRPKLWAVATIKPCSDCLPMELDKWQARATELRASTLEAHKDTPGVDWELGETVLDGQKVMYVYQIGTASTDGKGGGSYWFTNAYVAYYNDGVNEIRVAASYKDDPVTRKGLEKLAPKENLRELALSVLDVFTQAW